MPNSAIYWIGRGEFSHSQSEKYVVQHIKKFAYVKKKQYLCSVKLKQNIINTENQTLKYFTYLQLEFYSQMQIGYKDSEKFNTNQIKIKIYEKFKNKNGI